ncbi:MAG: serine dehydratase subunit alpha family protein [Clostridiales bacterium]|nr:serine dehydratase subunit alpha family protein [Candidatus Crickella caballi]
MHTLSKLIYDDMKPAFGVTEPGAIAFAVATAKEKVTGDITSVEVAMNSGMYKNAFTCGIPNSSRYGNLYAAALGAVSAKADLGLESLTYVTADDDKKAAEMVEAGIVKAYMDSVSSKIKIDATVKTDNDTCTVHIADSHTHIISIELNGETIYADKGANENVLSEDISPIPEIHKYTLAEILNYIKNVSKDEISFIRDAFIMNLDLLDEGLQSDRAVIAHELLKQNNGMLVTDDPVKTAQLLCNGAIEARVLGLSKPAMSITGSGAHGIIATMPLYAYFKSVIKSDDDELLLKATALSYLICMYIKEYSGKLSAFCGCGIAAGTGMACGLAYMQGADESQIYKVILNMSGSITGMICDGGNHGCAMKGVVATDAAFRSVSLAMADAYIEGIHGINGLTPEDTMRNMGLIASPGMVETEKTIVEIQESK